MSVITKISMFTSITGVESLIKLADFCESVFSDGNCGVFHYHLCKLYMSATLCTVIHIKDHMLSLTYFEKCFYHKKKYEALLNGKDYNYTAPLVSKVTSRLDVFPSLNPDFWEILREDTPSEFWDLIKENDKYSECFE